jgi:TonB family protein
MQDYPLAEAKAGIGGTTMVGFTITEEGRVQDPHVVESSGNSNLDAAALTCVVHWLYRPKFQSERPASQPWQVKVVWKISKTSLPLPLPRFAEPPPDCLRLYPVKPKDITGGNGTTEVRYTIDSTAQVHDAVVVHSSGNVRLDRAATECISKRKYRPLTAIMKNGQAMSWKMNMREQIKWNEAIRAEN